MTVNSTSPKPQLDKFQELARELECDEDEAKFEETVKKVAKAKPTEDQGSPSPEK